MSLTPMEAGALVSNWWDEINESPRWQDGIFYALCAAYALVSSVALVVILHSVTLFMYVYVYVACSCEYYFGSRSLRNKNFGFLTSAFFFSTCLSEFQFVKISTISFLRIVAL